jgi:hypothetical protein
MTPKEKAIELVDKYLDCENYNNLNLDLFCDECGMSTTAAKICALICVDEILQELENGDDGQTSIPYDYWQEVKNELNKQD